MRAGTRAGPRRKGGEKSGREKDPLPPDAGKMAWPDFLGLGDRGLRSPEDARTLVLPAPYERTVSYGRGTRNGPLAFLKASAQVELYDEELGGEPWKKIRPFTLPPVTGPSDPEGYLRKLAESASRFLTKDKVLFTIGGEHTITEGPLRAVAALHPGLTVFHIDAHADLRDEYEGTPYSHACAARRMMLYAKKIVQVGIRNISEDEVKYCNTEQVATYPRVRHRDCRKLLPRILKELSDPVYITIDVDGLDPSVIPGTGTPQPGGLEWYETLDMLRAICRRRWIVGADITELSPIPGQQVSEFAAARLAYKLLSYAFWWRRS